MSSNLLLLYIWVGMYASCSFKDYKFVTGSCSNDLRDRTKSTNVVALVSCRRQVRFKPLLSARFTAHLSGLAGTEGLKHVGFHRRYHIMERGDASCQKRNEV